MCLRITNVKNAGNISFFVTSANLFIQIKKISRTNLMQGNALTAVRKYHNMTIKHSIVIFLFFLFSSGCIKVVPFDIAGNSGGYPETKFFVISDPHYHSKELGTSGKAFEDYIKRSVKLLAYTEDIFRSISDDIISTSADFIIICGDLTKDGEKLNHEKFAAALENIRKNKKIFVVPGNHDVLNGAAFSYSGDSVSRVQNITPEDFKKIYRNFGYSAAIDEDSYSLSYMAEPVSGMYLLALDSCRWKENRPGKFPITDGGFDMGSLKWIEKVLKKASDEKKPVLAFMHHGLLEHYPGNIRNNRAYVIHSNNRVAELLASHGVKLVFTGHYHAQDITLSSIAKSGIIYDIETGSPATYPCPYRFVSISSSQIMTIRTRTVSKIESIKGDFSEFAYDFLLKGTEKKASRFLDKFAISGNDRKKFSSIIARSYITHIKGDEGANQFTSDTKASSLTGKIISLVKSDLIEGWLTDFPPEDNNLNIDLRK